MVDEEHEKFQCKRCRFCLFERKDLSLDHVTKQNCSLWYLRDDDMLPWVLKSVDEGGWSKGKLYCPKCEARIGAFDFVHLVSCACGGQLIPSIYCVKSKVDHMVKNWTAKVRNDVEKETGDGVDEDPSKQLGFPENTEQSCSTKILDDQNTGIKTSRLMLFDEDLATSFELSRSLSHECLTYCEDVDIDGSSENNFPCSHHNNPMKLYPTTCTFINQCFDPDVSDAEDTMLDMKAFCSTSAACGRPKVHVKNARSPCNSFYGISHRAHNSRIRSCQQTYREKCLSSCVHLYDCQNDFVNISYDASRAESVTRNCMRCSCRQYKLIESLSGETSSNHLSDITPVEDGLFNSNQTIHEDLIEVQHELLNLQNLLKDEPTPPSKCSKIPRKSRQRSFCTTSTDSQPSSKYCVPFNVDAEIDKVSEDELSEFELPDIYQCPVCLDILYDPHATVCRHTFCAPCLRQLHKVSRRRPLCPLCRQRIYSVDPCLNLQDDLKRLYPDLYRQRSFVELRRSVNEYPLPSPSTVRFEVEPTEVPGRIVHVLYVIRTCLVILFMLFSYLLNGEERNEHRRYARHFRVFFYLTISLVFACCGIGVGILFTFYAYDFIKFLIGFCLFYAIMTKLVVTYIASP